MDKATTFGLTRIAVGAAAWAKPELGLRATMLDPHAPQSPYLVRLFAARDIALGAVTLFTKPAHKRAVLGLGVMVDGADAGAALLALQKKQLEPVQAAVLAGAAGVAVLAGAVAIAQQGKRA